MSCNALFWYWVWCFCFCKLVAALGTRHERDTHENIHATVRASARIEAAHSAGDEHADGLMDRVLKVMTAGDSLSGNVSGLHVGRCWTMRELTPLRRLLLKMIMCRRYVLAQTASFHSFHRRALKRTGSRNEMFYEAGSWPLMHDQTSQPRQPWGGSESFLKDLLPSTPQMQHSDHTRAYCVMWHAW